VHSRECLDAPPQVGTSPGPQAVAARGSPVKPQCITDHGFIAGSSRRPPWPASAQACLFFQEPPAAGSGKLLREFWSHPGESNPEPPHYECVIAPHRLPLVTNFSKDFKGLPRLHFAILGNRLQPMLGEFSQSPSTGSGANRRRHGFHLRGDDNLDLAKQSSGFPATGLRAEEYSRKFP